MRRSELKADCTRCEALCCIATPFSASEDFALDKGAGEPCPNLGADHRCRIHSELAARGFPGCALYDCLGAGQRLTALFPRERGTAARNEAFLRLREVHQLLWRLTEAAKLIPAGLDPAVREALEARIASLEAVDPADAGALLAFDLEAHEAEARAPLQVLAEALGRRPPR